MISRESQISTEPSAVAPGQTQRGTVLNRILPGAARSVLFATRVENQIRRFDWRLWHRSLYSRLSSARGAHGETPIRPHPQI